MGTEIAAHIVYQEGRPIPGSDNHRVGSWKLDFFYRSYAAFALMADVRNGYRYSKVQAVAAPRGMPRRLTMDVATDAFPALREEERAVYAAAREAKDGLLDDNVRAMSQALYDKLDAYREGRLELLPPVYPDEYGHSWLTLAELREVERRYHNLARTLEPERAAHLVGVWADTAPVLSAMQAMEDAGREPALVFWFSD